MRFIINSIFMIILSAVGTLILVSIQILIHKKERNNRNEKFIKSKELKK